MSKQVCALTNPHRTSADHACTVMAELSPEVFNFFFNRYGPSVFGGSRGARQALICSFFEKLHKECLRQGIEQKWLPEQEKQIQEILNRLNFNP